MEVEDTYKTILKPASNILFKNKSSKFYGYAFPVTSEDESKTHLQAIKKEHHNARHWCYAYQIGKENISYRVNDDGEPNNTAGMPIYGQIQSFGLTNVLLVVVRYFGGVKLGVSGLINAYRTTAQMTLENSKIVTRTIDKQFLLNFEYKDMNTVMRIIKENSLKILDQDLALGCQIKISVRLKKANNTLKTFENVFGVKIKKL